VASPLSDVDVCRALWAFRVIGIVVDADAASPGVTPLGFDDDGLGAVLGSGDSGNRVSARCKDRGNRSGAISELGEREAEDVAGATLRLVHDRIVDTYGQIDAGRDRSRR